ncbi:PREDICTED: myeloperoxidase-like, partial [Branchiostoma belcheri]|uniref:Myeloperoxidase-like n=1 Tax=Branchiostoma belcheri TaxID=7741 RepID=A0A6P4Z5V1_BRABE
MLAKLIPMFFAAVAMAPLVVMVTGQGPSEEELQQAIAQATAENGAVSAGDEPEEDPFSGALNALASEHQSTPTDRELSRCATVLEKVAKHFLVGSGRRYTIEALSAIDIRNVTSVCDAICRQPTCPTPAVPEFRSANGRCNNRNHPLWGSSEQPLRRMLEPEYGDGLTTPRSKGRDGAPLPSARLVSTTMHEDLRKSSPVNTHMVMQFGQFLDHDITLTPNFQEQGLRCTCGTNCEQEERCFNINIPSVDPDFAGRPCLPFARSLSGPNEGCRLGRRQQLNQITAFVDASNVYGSSNEEIEELREHAGSAGSNQVTCPTGYERFQQNCFKAFPSQKDRSWLLKACMEDDGVLAMPKDAATNAFLVQLKNAVRTNVNFYIGLDDQTTEGQWRFADGTRLGSYNNWNPGQPNNGGDCVVLLPGAEGKWDDTSCSTGYFICQARGIPSGGNLALGRPTLQSGTTSGGVSSRAVDGNTDRRWGGGSCIFTNSQNKPWWRVDLGRSQAIDTVVVFSGSDNGYHNYLNNFNVHVGDSPTVRSNPQCGGNHPVAAGRQKITVDCDGRRGRYVGISLPHTQYLELCEVLVFGGALGLLKSRPNPEDANKKELLPAAIADSEVGCAEFTGNETCSQAGDVRVNEQPGLTSMHTVFLREHNRIARQLSGLNPHWDDDRVFFETRKIVGALMQKITYGEDLPLVLGPAAMTKFHLTLGKSNLNLRQSGFFSGYNARVNPTIFNVFATAAYRFGHSLVNERQFRLTPDFDQGSLCPIQLAFAFFNPSHVLNNDQGGPDSILRGLTAQPHQDFDRFMVSSLTKHLFADPPGSLGLDLAALNIQRGRDHGLPGYNAWRVMCGLPKANSFDELVFEIPDRYIRLRLEDVYSHVDDIDVFVGGLAEESVRDGIVGPTFACLIGLQFQALRMGDRFWFENEGQFTAVQLAEIRKTSLARILCDNTDDTTHMQPDVFRLPTQPGNERVACSSLPQMDLTKWQALQANSRVEEETAVRSGRGLEDRNANEKLERVAEEARSILELLGGGQKNIFREENAKAIRENLTPPEEDQPPLEENQPPPDNLPPPEDNLPLPE